ncbi:uncharacterized protein At4g13200, chloroplastic [Ricinus communis]|uniref:Uncharacterized protein n=1 Tax=Ricinus communis TaxID=3988 RepID=B9S542_RICCO|nr:uncharacterized protein At4g13200, chloroplastic [Ricinus communis]EEF41262.1 conserved hypothetical protein [Ricinus communis]|eukprot:XP_002521111.1 uncharacterized protein At4g13200, chloroplastic [Ricinus communis]
MSGVLPSPPFISFSSIKSNNQTTNFSCALSPVTNGFSDLKLKKNLAFGFRNETTQSHTINLRCNSTTGPGGPGSGDNESRSVLDAFFLGKALAEAVNERVESAVGEFLSTIGRLQAEQQRQIQDFQEDVLERARKAKENAAWEAMEAQGLVSKPSTVDAASTTYGINSATSSSTTTNAVTPTNSSSSPNSTAVSTAQTGSDPAGGGTGFGALNDD